MDKGIEFGETLEYVREVLPLNTFSGIFYVKYNPSSLSLYPMRIAPWNVNLQAFVRKLVITWVKRFFSE